VVVANFAVVPNGTGETSVTVTWPGSPFGTGALAPAPSLWHTDAFERLVYFGVDTNFCYGYSP